MKGLTILMGALLALLTLPATVACGADKEVEWLKQNAKPFASLEADAALDDLAPLADAIGEARVVFLGEQTHGDGATFAAKIRMIRFLHERMDFDVLVFESGMYGCREANAELQRGISAPTASVGLGVFPIWTRSAQTTPLWRYLAKTAKGDRPLELAGYDCQVTGAASGSIVKDLTAVAAEVGFAGDDLDRVKSVVAKVVAYEAVPGWKKARKKIAKSFDLFGKALAKPPKKGSSFDVRTRAFWKQFTQSLLAQAENITLADQRKGKRMADEFNPRDAQGGKNMLWLANEHYAGKKLIVWCATMHAQRNAGSIDTQSPSLNYKGLEPAGHHTWKALGDACYIVGFVSAEGRAGLPWGKPWPLEPVTKNSFEDLCVRAGLENAFVDLRGTPPKHWLRSRQVARPLGNSAMRAVWPDVLDALVFLKTSVPSTSATATSGGAPKQEPGDPFDLLPAVEEGLANIRNGQANGNVWATKWDLSDVWTRWVAALRPDAAAIAAEETELRNWWKGQDTAKSLAWRVHDLLALMAVERGARKEALDRFDEAIAAYPDQTVPDPSKHSAFQHLVNRAAFVRVKVESPAKARAWATARLATDKRFQYFWTGAWQEHVDAKEYGKLLDDVVKAYKRRIKAFPDEKERIEQILARLD